MNHRSHPNPPSASPSLRRKGTCEGSPRCLSHSPFCGYVKMENDYYILPYGSKHCLRRYLTLQIIANYTPNTSWEGTWIHRAVYVHTAVYMICFFCFTLGTQKFVSAALQKFNLYDRKMAFWPFSVHGIIAIHIGYNIYIYICSIYIYICTVLYNLHIHIGTMTISGTTRRHIYA